MRRVCSRATWTHHVVMSEPFLPKTAHAAKSTSATRRSASSTITGGGVVEAVSEPPLLPGRRLHPGVPVAEHHRTVSAHEIEELVAVHVPVARALGSMRVVRRRAGRDEGGRGVTVDSAGDHLPRPFEELLGTFELHARSPTPFVSRN